MNAPSTVLLALCCFLLGVQAYNYRAHPKVRLFRDIPFRCVLHSRTPVRCGAAPDALLPHPDHCGLFYQCVAQRPVCRQCPVDLHFNPVLHVCDWPQVAGCTVNATTTAAPSNATSPAPTNNATSSAPPSNSTWSEPPSNSSVTLVPNDSREWNATNANDTLV